MRGRTDAPPRSPTAHMKRRMGRPSSPGACFSAPRFSEKGARFQKKDAGPPRHRPGGLVRPRKCAVLVRFEAAEGALGVGPPRGDLPRVARALSIGANALSPHVTPTPLGSSAMAASRSHPVVSVPRRPVSTVHLSVYVSTTASGRNGLYRAYSANKIFLALPTVGDANGIDRPPGSK